MFREDACVPVSITEILVKADM